MINSEMYKRYLNRVHSTYVQQDTSSQPASAYPHHCPVLFLMLCGEVKDTFQQLHNKAPI